MRRSDEARCRRVERQLALAAGQDLSGRGGRRVWNHLAQCVPCRRRYSEYLELRSALTSLDPAGGEAAQDAVVPRGFFGHLQRDILSRVEDETPPPRTRQIWIGSAVAAVLFLTGALVIRAWLPAGAGLLDREPIPPLDLYSGFDGDLTPLAYPQGLGARRQADRLLEEEAFEVTPAHHRPGPDDEPRRRGR